MKTTIFLLFCAIQVVISQYAEQQVASDEEINSVSSESSESSEEYEVVEHLVYTWPLRKKVPQPAFRD